VNLVWSKDETVAPESIPAIPAHISALIEDINTLGKLVE
jgi:hypothetical protein